MLVFRFSLSLLVGSSSHLDSHFSSDLLPFSCSFIVSHLVQNFSKHTWSPLSKKPPTISLISLINMLSLFLSLFCCHPIFGQSLLASSQLFTSIFLSLYSLTICFSLHYLSTLLDLPFSSPSFICLFDVSNVKAKMEHD